MKKQLLYVCAFITIIFTVFIVSCNREKLAERQPNLEKEITIEEVKTWYEKVQSEKGDDFNNEIARKIGIPDWSTANWQKPDPNTPALLTVNLDINFGGYGIRRLVFMKEKEEIKAAILQCVGELAYLQHQKGVIDSKNFTGDCQFLNLSGRLIGGYRLKDGKITFELKPNNDSSPVLETTTTGETTTEGWVTLYGVTVYSYTGWTYMNVYTFYNSMGVYNYSGCYNCTTPPTYYYGGGSTPQPSVNQTIIDSLEGYPCAQQILRDLPSCNASTDSILTKVFGVNDKVNIVYKAESSWNSSSSPNGGVVGSSVIFNSNTGVFNVTIKLSAWSLQNSSKEFTAKTFIHEAIHALIDYRWMSYKNGFLDSNTFKAVYPKIWDYKNKPYSNLAQHTQIADAFIDDIKNVIRGYNPGIADSVSTAIAWSGLYETQAWKDLGSDTFRMNRLRKIARGDSTQQSMIDLLLKSCN